MTRNQFLKMMNLGLFGLITRGFQFEDLYANKVSDKKFKKWVWMNPWRDISDDEYKRRFEKIKSAGIDAILPNVYRSWKAEYTSNHLPMSEPLLEQFLPIAKEMGLEVHAWMWTMICNNEDIHKKNPSWFAINRNGQSTIDHPAYVGYYRFMCPNNPGVQEFVSKTVTELSYIDDLDGIHLDYVRLPDVILAKNLQSKYDIVQDKEYPEYDYCYCDICRSQFKELTNIDISTSKSPDENNAWRKFRYDSVTNMVNNFLVPAARSNNKFISAAVFPNWEHVRQQWSKWDLDAFFPMLYHEFYDEDIDWIIDNVIKGKSSISKTKELYCGVMVDMFDRNRMKEALVRSFQAGADGVSFFGYNSLERMGLELIPELDNKLDKLD